MLNAIWMGMIVLSFAGALMTGNLTALSKAAADGAQNAVTTALLLLGAMCLWLGMMNIAREAGVTAWLSRALSPLIRRLFPEYAGEKAVHEKISMSGGDRPTKGMVLFVVMNTTAFQLIPSSVVTLRAAYGSADPYDIMVHIWFVSLGSLLLCIAVCKVLERFAWKS